MSINKKYWFQFNKKNNSNIFKSYLKNTLSLIIDLDINIEIYRFIYIHVKLRIL